MCLGQDRELRVTFLAWSFKPWLFLNLRDRLLQFYSKSSSHHLIHQSECENCHA
jgi:hypothetical protein